MAVRTPLRMTTSRCSLMVYLLLEIRLSCDSGMPAPEARRTVENHNLRGGKRLADAVEALEHQVFVQLEGNGQAWGESARGASRQHASELRLACGVQVVEALDRPGLRVLATAGD